MTGSSQDEIQAMTIRLPKWLHSWLSDQAHFEHTTMNQITTDALIEKREAILATEGPGILLSGGGWLSGSPAG